MSPSSIYSGGCGSAGSCGPVRPPAIPPMGPSKISRPWSERGFVPTCPCQITEQRTPYFGKRHFRYDPDRDVYICPRGASLRPSGVSQVDRTIRYKAAPSSCRACPQRAQCTTNPWGRVVTRLMDEAFLDRARAYQQTEPYQKAIRKRSVWVEPLFAEAKDWHGLRRFRLRWLGASTAKRC